jgi:chorismate mutase/prephenate dehydratase
MTRAGPDTSLASLRREMDEIDDAMLALLARRITASRRVKSEKSTTGALARSPLRPAREAEILRRLLAKGRGQVPADLMVRLWRVILTSSSLMQAPVTIHLPHSLFTDMASRLMLRDHFGPMAVAESRDETEALAALAGNGGDIAVCATGSAWTSPFLGGTGGDARVVAVLPVLRQPMPEFLVFGHAQPQPSGDDESLVVNDKPFTAETLAMARWHAQAGKAHIAAFPGFDAGPAGLARAGCYPTPLEASP